MIAYLEAHRDGATWLVAVQGSTAAAAIILETGGQPVMANCIAVSASAYSGSAASNTSGGGAGGLYRCG